MQRELSRAADAGRRLAVLTTGKLPLGEVTTFLHFLEEALLSIVVMATEHAAQQSAVPIAQVWHNVDLIAAAWSCTPAAN